MKGSVYKRCGCRDPHTGRVLGRACPQLKRANGSWNPRHGSWHIQCDLPHRANGKRRTLRHSGYLTQDDGDAALLHLNTLLAIPDRSDSTTRTALADLIEHTIATDGRLPDTDTVRRALQSGTRLIGQPTVGEWLEQWLAGKRNLADSTRANGQPAPGRMGHGPQAHPARAATPRTRSPHRSIHSRRLGTHRLRVRHRPHHHHRRSRRS